MKIKTKQDRRDRIKLRLRKRITGTAERPRITVYRSLTHMYAQAVDDAAGRTVASASTVESSIKGALAAPARAGNRQGAEAVGKAIAERLLARGVTQAVFDRNGFLYHGRVQAVAEAARKAGLEF